MSVDRENAIMDLWEAQLPRAEIAVRLGVSEQHVDRVISYMRESKIDRFELEARQASVALLAAIQRMQMRDAR